MKKLSFVAIGAMLLSTSLYALSPLIGSLNTNQLYADEKNMCYGVSSL
ncbi:MAG: hypothetical protein IE878_04480, partial [Epsilonproteobacteria bacterium]|nr:hypothetical protein [Campylobacterota bacterium]